MGMGIIDTAIGFCTFLVQHDANEKIAQEAFATRAELEKLAKLIRGENV